MSLWLWKKAKGDGWSVASAGGLLTLGPVVGGLLLAFLLMLLATLRGCGAAG